MRSVVDSASPSAIVRKSYLTGSVGVAAGSLAGLSAVVVHSHLRVSGTLVRSVHI